MADRPQKIVDLFVDERFTPKQRQQIGEQAIKYIKNRARQGRGVGNKPLTPISRVAGDRESPRHYSKTYIQSREFKIAAKSQSPINMKLTGDMLDSLEVLDLSLPGRVRIGYPSAGFDSDKAWFNIEKGYNFLDLTDSEVETIIKESKVTQRGGTGDIATSIATAIASELFSGE